jgi:pumilio family protein 6
MLRELKNHIAKYASLYSSLLIVPTIFETVDDTVLVNKMVLTPLIGRWADSEEQAEAIFQAALDPYACLALLYLPSEGNNIRDSTHVGRSDIAVLDKAIALRSNTSKKDPSVRRQELLAAISPALIKVVELHAGPLLQDSRGTRFANEVLLGCVGDKTTALEAVADAVQGDPNAEGHLALQWFCGKMLKTLVSGGRYDRSTKSINREFFI